MNSVKKLVSSVMAAAIIVSVPLTASALNYSGATTITSATTQSSKTYASSTADQNSLLINTSGNVNINNPTVTKSGDSDGGDNCNFYGTNSGVLVMGGGTTTITGGTIKATAKGANGVFSYGGNGGNNNASGDGTTVNISNTEITTTGDNGGGIMTTGGGITNAANLTINTSGTSSAAIRTDRGGGTVTVNGGTYNTTGAGSPSIYSTAAITVSDASLNTTKSEAVVIEGKNSVTLNNCTVVGNNSQLNGQSTTNENVKIYQSMSGDAASGTSSFTMNGGTMTCKTGSMFHVTNTAATINLNNATLINSSSGVLLNASADSWGTAGNNGGSVTLNASNQALNGIITVDSISSLNLKLSNSSTYSGKINTSGTAGNVYVEVPDGCTWTLTGDSYITSLTCSASSINLNGYKLYVNGKEYTSGTSSTGSEVTSSSSSSSSNTPGNMPGNMPNDMPGMATISTVALSQTTYNYDGKVKTPSVTVKDSNGREVPSNDYSVTYSSGRKNVGTYSVTVSFKGPFSTAKTLYFKILPKSTAISKLKSAKKKITLKWKKITSQTTGYQIQISTNKSFSKNTKTITVKNNKKTSKTISGLSSKKKYYVRIRTYKTVNNTKYYSSWSVVKSIKTK